MSKRKILLVDDDPDLLRGLSVRLFAAGYEVLFATDGMAATATAVKERPDVILLDLGLPAGDGFVVMSRLRNLPALNATPIVVLTGRDSGHNREKALRAGAAAFFQKPIEPGRLLDGIRRVLEGDVDLPVPPANTRPAV
jgi:DNA-binding response OmpR family regulator